MAYCYEIIEMVGKLERRWPLELTGLISMALRLERLETIVSI